MALLLRPLYWVIWSNQRRRARKLLQFSQVEAQGGRILVRAAERTGDPALRRKFMAHARDEERHARMFRARGMALRTGMAGPDSDLLTDWIAPGEQGLDGLRVEEESAASLLAFIHLAESAAARDFAAYDKVLGHDLPTRAVFENILRDEEYHMRYSLAELQRVAPGRSRALLWQARARRLWKAYLRLAGGIANVMSTVLLTLQYFILLPPFALLAKLAARRERAGWSEIPQITRGDSGRES